MPDPLFSNVVLPVESEADARATVRAALPYLEDVDGRATVLYVVEKAGGAPDKMSVEQAETYAATLFDAVADVVDGRDVAVETEVAYGTDVGETVLEFAADVDASAVGFTPQGTSRLVKLLTGDVTETLLDESDRPVVTLPEGTDG